MGEPYGDLKKWSPALVAPAMILFVILHGCGQWSGKTAMSFVLIIFFIGWMFETLSIYTGFPFGNYHYGENMWPFIGHVPVSVLPAYWVMAYLCWNLAHLFFDHLPQKRRGVWLHPIPIIGAALMVLWDVSMDPLRAITEQRWYWLDGGSYYGVPLTNFIGWFVVTWLMLQCFALLMDRSGQDWESRPNRNSRAYWLPVPLLYLAFPVEYLLNPLFLKLREDAVQISTNVVAIYEQIAIITLSTMVPVAALAILLLVRPFGFNLKLMRLLPTIGGGKK